MKLVKQLTALLALSFIFACTPSVNSAYKSSIDSQLSNTQRSGQTFNHAPKAALAVGQWVQYKNVDGDGNPSIQTMKIIGEEGGLYWVQFDIQSYYTTISQRMLMSVPTHGPDLDIVRILQKRDQETDYREMDSFEMSMFKRVQSVTLKTLTWQSVSQPGTESVRSSAGQFDGCVVRDEHLSVWGVSFESQNTVHNAVPFSGTVRAINKKDPRQVTELLAFGYDGQTNLGQAF